MTDFDYPLRSRRVWVAGHKGMVGAAVARRLAREDAVVISADRAQVDLTRQAQVEDWLGETRTRLHRRRGSSGRRYPGEQHVPR